MKKLSFVLENKFVPSKIQVINFNNRNPLSKSKKNLLVRSKIILNTY